METEFHSAYGQLKEAISSVLSVIAPMRYRETSFNTPSAPLERWARKFTSDKWQLPSILAVEQARVTLVDSEGFSNKPFFKPWAKERYHPGFMIVKLVLQYRQGAMWGNLPISLQLPELDDRTPLTIKLHYSTSSREPVDIPAGTDDLVFLTGIISNELPSPIPTRG